MKTLKQSVVAFLVGVGIGQIVECVISMIVGNMAVGVPSFVTAHDPVFVKIIQTLLYGGFGIVSVLAGKFTFERNSGALVVKAIIHFAILIGYFSFVGFYLHWFTFTIGYLINLIIFALMYCGIFFGIYYFERKKIRLINERLEELHRS